MDGYDFSSIMLAFLYLSVSVENVSVTSKTLGGDNRSMLCAVVIPNVFASKLFASSRLINGIVAITQKIWYVNFYDAYKRFWVEQLALQRPFWYFSHRLLFNFLEKKRSADGMLRCLVEYFIISTGIA